MTVEGSLERILNSVLPHEVTHTIFAAKFGRPLPRWADEGGAVLSEDATELEDRSDRSLPGAARGGASVRKVRPTVRVSAVAFAPTGRTFCAATTEGLLLYALDTAPTFDPLTSVFCPNLELFSS